MWSALKAAVILSVSSSAALAALLQSPSELPANKNYDYIIIGGTLSSHLISHQTSTDD